MSDTSQLYILPSHPSLVAPDPLSISEKDNASVWDVIAAAIGTFCATNRTANNLPALIEDLVYAIHGKGNINTRFLSRLLLQDDPNIAPLLSSSLLESILESCLAMPVLFPSHCIQHLSPSSPIFHLTEAQSRCLLAHQILGTLSVPKGNDWGSTFLCWFSDPQPYPEAIRGYLESLFHHFSLRPSKSRHSRFEYCAQIPPPPDQASALWMECTTTISDHIVLEPITTSSTRFPHANLTCTLVASNSSPGFGAACTQEELITGACPALLPLGALCVSPPLPADACLVAFNIHPASSWRNQGRNARMMKLENDTRDHTFLFIDALELDVLESPTPIADVHPPFLLRELHKAHVGLSAIRSRGISEIASPLWGTGAFGGDPIVKALVLAMAAAHANVTIHLAVDTGRLLPSGRSVINALQSLIMSYGSISVGDIFLGLMREEAQACLDSEALLATLFPKIHINSK